MVLQQCDYYFAEACVKQAFNDCYSLLFNELNVEKAWNLSTNVKIHDLAEQLEEYSETNILVTEKNLSEKIIELFDCYEIDIEALFITEKEIRERVKVFEQRITELETDYLKSDFSFEVLENSSLDLLFKMRYAMQCSLELTEINEHESTFQLKFEDFDYSTLTDRYETYLDESYIIKSFKILDYAGDKDHFDVIYALSTSENLF